MHPNQQTLETFYGAFARLDPDTMASCYADDVSFDDEVFSLGGKVRGQAGANLQRFLAKEPR